MVGLKYRADKKELQADGAILWFANWLGGPTLSKIENCRIESLQPENMRVTAFITGDADTYFSIPATCSFLGKVMRGYITSDDEGNIVFRHVNPN